MSPSAPIRLFSRIVATLLAAGILAACGYKGPLYLPPDQEDGEPRQPDPGLNLPSQNDILR